MSLNFSSLAPPQNHLHHASFRTLAILLGIEVKEFVVPPFSPTSNGKDTPFRTSKSRAEGVSWHFTVDK